METISLQSSMTLYSTVYAVDQFNGDIYRVGSVGQSSDSAIYVERYNKNGVFIEQINPSLKYYGNSPSIVVNDSNIWVMSSSSGSGTYYYNYYRSKNGVSNSYSYSTPYGNGEAFHHFLACGSKIIQFYSQFGGSGSNQWQLYDILAWDGTQIQRYNIQPSVIVGSGGVTYNSAFVCSNSDIFDGYYIVKDIYYHIHFNTVNNSFSTNQISRFPNGNRETRGFLYNGYTCYFTGLSLVRLNTDGSSTIIGSYRTAYSTSGGCFSLDTVNIFEQKYLIIPYDGNATSNFFIVDLAHKTICKTTFGWGFSGTSITYSYFDPVSNQLLIKNVADINFSRFTLTKANIKFGVPTGDPNYQYDEYIRF